MARDCEVNSKLDGAFEITHVSDGKHSKVHLVLTQPLFDAPSVSAIF